ncbi:unnamed protein product [Gongylonema pulchrum]|uniref:Sema domain-containing protein n=1 Tax=Gongylonema pulchrum TaxID=637853 RepID=A0A183CXD7_9BILA|nr:unnamed protein product [Gongylonema pulchrum]
MMKGFSEEKCHNYITQLLKYGDDCLYICGTNALSPRCTTRKKWTLSEECEGTVFSAIGLSAFSSDCAALHLSFENYTFTAVSVDIACQKRTLLRALPHRERLWIPVNDDRWFHDPEFIALLGWKQYVFVIFNEKNPRGLAMWEPVAKQRYGFRIAAMDVASAGNGSFQVVAISTAPKVYGLVFHETSFHSKWSQQIPISEKILRLDIRNKVKLPEKKTS